MIEATDFEYAVEKALRFGLANGARYALIEPPRPLNREQLAELVEQWNLLHDHEGLKRAFPELFPGADTSGVDGGAPGDLVDRIRQANALVDRLYDRVYDLRWLNFQAEELGHALPHAPAEFVELFEIHLRAIGALLPEMVPLMGAGSARVSPLE